ncbi:MAG: alpha/beta fold hydrolase [Acidimicrobiales bacterium]
MKLLRVRHGEVELSVQVSGEGPTLLLLHGWPDSGALWDEMVPDFLNRGYRVAAPDLRGCGLSSKPTDTASYKMARLVGDVASIIDALGDESVTLVGHDWGAALAWSAATHLPERVNHLVALSVGHPTSFYSAGIEQQMRSWYMMLFSQEGLGEAFLRRNDYEAIRRWSGHPHAQQVIERLERDGQMSAHLRWYRANVPLDAFVVDPPQLPPLDVPVLGIWSSADPALTERQMTRSGPYCARGFTYVRLEGPGHWMMLEVPHDVSREILNFLDPLAPRS